MNDESVTIHYSSPSVHRSSDLGTVEHWRNLKLVLEYDGTAYSGFQVQANAPSIQGEVERAIAQVVKGTTRIIGAGRTDAGVHARGQVVSFRTDSALPTETIMKALNFYLPEDIAVVAVEAVPAGFNARRSAISREYEYTILNRTPPSPFWRRFAYHMPGKLNVDRMVEASRLLEGEHDFAAFAEASAATRSTVRRMIKAEVSREGDLLKLRFVADAFLPHQVRNMVGTLLWVGTGRLDGAGFRQIMEGRDRRRAGPAVPPHGLCLVRVNYR